MDNPEKPQHWVHKTQDEDKQNKNTPLYAQKHANKVCLPFHKLVSLIFQYMQ